MTTNLLNVIFCQCLRCNIHSILLHLLAHISILNHSLSLFRHGGFCCLLWLVSSVPSICAIDCLIKNNSRALTTFSLRITDRYRWNEKRLRSALLHLPIYLRSVTRGEGAIFSSQSLVINPSSQQSIQYRTIPR